MISKQTTLDLNGPILSFIQQPQSVSVCDSGSATFVGIATAFFPTQDPPNPASNTGTLSYRWNAEGFGPLTDGTFQGATITGSGTTTLTITNAISPVANGLRLFVGVDYVPSAYSQPVGSAVTVGTGRSTGNAVNEILNSNTATLTVFPVLTVAQQPTEQTVAQNRSATFTTLGALTDTTQGSISYRWQLNGSDLSDTSTIIGSGTTALSIALPNIGINTVRARLTHPTSCNSPIFTNTVNFNVVEPRQILTAEGYNNTSTAVTLDFDLRDGNYSIDSSVIDSDTICIYASEKDLEVEVDLYASNGSNVGSFAGGQGGYSKVRFPMKQNEEFIITGIRSNSGLFLYRKGSLIAVVGQGGSAGSSGNGGAGGGVNVAGANGSGRSSGGGGPLINSGQLTTSGIFGSLSNVSTSSIRPGDSKATEPLGGRTISCPKGNYWISQGKSPCEDVGNVTFRLSNGTEVTNSAIITRGFKDGYAINATAGRGADNGGNGGVGATGGSGGVGSGGGGGSGYTNGFANIITTGLGGNIGRTRINIRSTIGNFFIDSFGRILILSAATVGKDPRTLTKTTDRVLVNTDTCIDDARWQQFIELARTQNYRLTATLNNRTTKIISATDNNIRRMINSNNITLKNSLTAWEDTNYNYQLLALAWDETNTSGGRGFGVDYSILSWSPPGAYGFGYYGDSSNPFFVGSTYNHFTANWWILPPGVPDF
jgi:hypothetical protein